MKVEVLAFGIAKDIFNGKSVSVELAGVTNVGALRTALEIQYPQLKALRSYMIAVNDEYAEDNIPLNPTDEIAVIPPVSGG